ncbi:MAG: NUDIX hydrolase [Arcobacteraceae bacterium]|nr:NUDIX hydrolase [Arcobacteraceae bacterium]
MLTTKEKEIIFVNKYIELQNNLVENVESKKVFKHIKIIENGTTTPGAVVLCEYKEKYLLLENYRYGIDEICIELPRGYIEKNESLENCAIRELYEETNIIFNKRTDNITKIGEISINSSIIASKVSLFLININQEINDIQLQNTEHIKSYSWYSKEEIYKDIKEGKIIDSFTISSLLFYSLME